MKSVIHTFTTTLPNGEPYATGIADFFKGCISLYQYSRIMNFNLFIYFNEHPIGAFLEPNALPLTESDLKRLQLLQCINTRPLNLRTRLADALEHSDIVKIQCNLDYEQEPDRETIEFILKNFRPCATTLQRIHVLKKEMGLVDDFIAIHIRTGDTFMIEQSEKEHDKRFLIPFDQGRVMRLAKAIDYFREYFSGPVFLLSDNSLIKEFVAKKYDFQTTKFIPMHSGALARDDSSEKSEQLLIEFLIMCSASKVICYSVFGHSGFSDMAEILYGVTLDKQFI